MKDVYFHTQRSVIIDCTWIYHFSAAGCQECRGQAQDWGVGIPLYSKVCKVAQSQRVTCQHPITVHGMHNIWLIPYKRHNRDTVSWDISPSPKLADHAGVTWIIKRMKYLSILMNIILLKPEHHIIHKWVSGGGGERYSYLLLLRAVIEGWLAKESAEQKDDHFAAIKAEVESGRIHRMIDHP